MNYTYRDVDGNSVGEGLVSDSLDFCIVCNLYTDLVEICFEARICSGEFLQNITKEYFESLK